MFGETETQSIAIADGRISWIGNIGAIPKSFKDARRLDGNGARALPGLIDSHVHFDALPAAKFRQRELNVATEIYPITMRQTLASGVTTARVHLSALEDMAVLRAISDDACFPAPRLALSGPGLRGGTPGLDARLMRGAEDVADLDAKIDELSARGAHWIALHAPSAFSDAEKDVIRAASTRHDVKFMVDGDAFDDFAAALDIPVTSIEYLNRTDRPVYPDEIVAALRDREPPIYVSAPVGYYRRSAQFGSATNKTLDRSVFAFVPDTLEALMRESFPAAFAKDQYIARAIAAYPTMEMKFKQLRDAGALMVASSDSGSLGQFHHDAIWVELSAWRSFDIATQDIVAGATSVPAMMLNRADIGALIVGAHGDVILYAGELDETGFSRDHVQTVIKGGVIFVTDGEWTGPDAAAMTARISELSTAN